MKADQAGFGYMTDSAAKPSNTWTALMMIAYYQMFYLRSTYFSTSCDWLSTYVESIRMEIPHFEWQLKCILTRLSVFYSGLYKVTRLLCSIAKCVAVCACRA